MCANPFKPTAGKLTPILPGREDIIQAFSEGLHNGAGALEQTMLISGQRGFGKTALLVELARTAKSCGWLVVRQTATEGMCSRIVKELQGNHIQITEASAGPSAELNGVGKVGIVGKLAFDTPSSQSIRTAANAKLSHLPAGKGILFAIDEGQANAVNEIATLAIAVQEITGDEDVKSDSDLERHGVAFVFAGLPAIVDKIKHDAGLTFIGRGMPVSLGNVPEDDVQKYYQTMVKHAGRSIADDAAREAACISQGYPHMIQLVGYLMWQHASHRKADAIEMQDVEFAEAEAVRLFKSTICDSIYASLTDSERRFVEAMAADYPNVSTTATIMKRLGKKQGAVTMMRNRLVHNGVITATDESELAFAVPYFREYVAERADWSA